MSQCRKRIEASGATCRPETGSERHQYQQKRHRNERKRLEGTGLKHTSQKLAHANRTTQTKRKADSELDRRASKDQPPHLAGLRAERHPHADFPRTLDHAMGGDRI